MPKSNPNPNPQAPRPPRRQRKKAPNDKARNSIDLIRTHSYNSNNMNTRIGAERLEEPGVGSFFPLPVPAPLPRITPPPDKSPMKELFRNLLKLQELQFDSPGGSTAEAAISQLRKKIPLPILEHYDRLAVRGKKGVAIVRNQVCTGCHMRIPIGAINTLLHGEDIQMCETCGRYLYLPPETPPQPVEAAPAPAKPAAKPAAKPVKAKRKKAKTAAGKNQTE
jgi:hypothetical protein